MRTDQILNAPLLTSRLCAAYVRLMHYCLPHFPEQSRSLKFDAILNLSHCGERYMRNLGDADSIDLGASIMILASQQIDELEMVLGDKISAVALKQVSESNTVSRFSSNSSLLSLLRSGVGSALNLEQEQSIRYCIAAIKKLSGREGVNSMVQFAMNSSRPLVREISVSGEIDHQADCLQDFIVEYLERSDSESARITKKETLLRMSLSSTGAIREAWPTVTLEQIDSDDEGDIKSTSKFIFDCARMLKFDLSAVFDDYRGTEAS